MSCFIQKTINTCSRSELQRKLIGVDSTYYKYVRHVIISTVSRKAYQEGMFMPDVIATNYKNGLVLCSHSLDLCLFNDSIWISKLSLDSVEWNGMMHVEYLERGGFWRTWNHLSWCWPGVTEEDQYISRPEFRAYEMWLSVAGLLVYRRFEGINGVH
jgi:hypothetical protein